MLNAAAKPTNNFEAVIPPITVFIALKLINEKKYNITLLLLQLLNPVIHVQ